MAPSLHLITWAGSEEKTRNFSKCSKEMKRRARLPKEGMHDGWKVRRIRPQVWGWWDPIRKHEHCPVEATGGLITLSYGQDRR